TQRSALSITHHASPSLHTLSLHDALPIFYFYEIGSTDLIWNDLFNNFEGNGYLDNFLFFSITMKENFNGPVLSHFMFHCFILLSDRKSTRLNSSHVSISYAVFCLKKKIIH